MRIGMFFKPPCSLTFLGAMSSAPGRRSVFFLLGGLLLDWGIAQAQAPSLPAAPDGPGEIYKNLLAIAGILVGGMLVWRARHYRRKR